MQAEDDERPQSSCQEPADRKPFFAIAGERTNPDVKEQGEEDKPSFKWPAQKPQSGREAGPKPGEEPLFLLGRDIKKKGDGQHRPGKKVGVGGHGKGEGHGRTDEKGEGGNAISRRKTAPHDKGQEKSRDRGREGEEQGASMGDLRDSPSQLGADPVLAGHPAILGDKEELGERGERLRAGGPELAHGQDLAAETGGVFIIRDGEI